MCAYVRFQLCSWNNNCYLHSERQFRLSGELCACPYGSMLIHGDCGDLCNHLPGKPSRVDFHHFDSGQLPGSDDDWKLRNSDLFASFWQRVQCRNYDGHLQRDCWPNLQLQRGGQSIDARSFAGRSAGLQ